MSSAVVYYSRYGNSRFVAEEIARRIGAEAIELVEARGPRRGLRMLLGVIKAIRNKSSKLAGDPWSHVRNVETLWMVTPIWASSAPPAANAFLKEAHLAGARVNVVTLQADPATEGSDRVHEQLAERIRTSGGTVGSLIPLHSERPGKFAGEEALRQQVDQTVDPLVS